MEERLQREGKEKEEEIEATRLKAEEMEHEEKKKTTDTERQQEVLERQEKVRASCQAWLCERASQYLRANVAEDDAAREE